MLTVAVLFLSSCGKEAAIHDTTKKENTHQSGLSEAKAAGTGSTETLSGKYKIEGTDGLMKSKPVDGVYGVVNNGPGYVFYRDGTIEVVTTHDATVTEDNITFGGCRTTGALRMEKYFFTTRGVRSPPSRWFR